MGVQEEEEDAAMAELSLTTPVRQNKEWTTQQPTYAYRRQAHTDIEGMNAEAALLDTF